jgi:hypothetical protein
MPKISDKTDIPKRLNQGTAARVAAALPTECSAASPGPSSETVASNAFEAPGGITQSCDAVDAEFVEHVEKEVIERLGLELRVVPG